MADNYAIIRVGNYKAKDVRKVYGECVRDYDLAKCINSDIDIFKSGDNIKLGNCNIADPLQHIKDYKKNNNIKGRFNIFSGSDRNETVLMTQFFVGLTPELMNSLSPDAQKEYFRKAIDFVRATYPTFHLINAVIHYDEATPHMHINALPLMPNNKGELTFNVTKAMKGKYYFRDLQDLYYSFMIKKFPEYNLKRGDVDSKKKHLSCKEGREKKALLEELDRQIEAKKAELSKIEDLTPVIVNTSKYYETDEDFINSLF